MDINSIIKKYEGKRLTTDEVALAKREISNAIELLENIKYETGPDSLLLKWGTLKGRDFHSDKAIPLLKEYGEIGSNPSAMFQKDTDRQKEIICELIDLCDGVIQSDWSGEYFTKESAKDYVRSYAE